MTENHILELKTTILSGPNENILKFGSYAGAIIGTIFMIQIIKQIVALIVHFRMINATHNGNYYRMSGVNEL